MFKLSPHSNQEEIRDLFRNLNEKRFHTSLPMQQFLFDELAAVYLSESKRNNAAPFDCWDRCIALLTCVVECLDGGSTLEEYSLPFHPSIIDSNSHRQPLLDLFFFYCQRSIEDDSIKCTLVNKIAQSKPPNIRGQRAETTIAANIFQKLQVYFLIRSTALLLCDRNNPAEDLPRINRIVDAVIETHLTVGEQITKISENLQLFLSTIISKRSWNFLIQLLRSEHIQQFHSEWADLLYRVLKSRQADQRNECVQHHHQIQFTLSVSNQSSLFPHLHQPYEKLKEIIANSVKQSINDDQRWAELLNWTVDSRNDASLELNLREIKVMLLLNIYYDYFCQNRLAYLDTILPFIENQLEPLPEELRVFRALLQPEQYMIGHLSRNDPINPNHLNRLFSLDYKEDDELGIRHSLVNLLAMILLGGKHSFLWTFAFEPSSLSNTFGKLFR
jgi:hypothetical protein